VARRVGTRDPAMVPSWMRTLLGVKFETYGTAHDYAPGRHNNEVVAFIANPTKPGVAELREQALRACSNRYMPQPMWLYTTPTDAGSKVASEAIKAGANVV